MGNERTTSLNDVRAHYDQIREADRLSLGPGQLELVRTQEIIGRFLRFPAAKVLDVGGGPGTHAAWLLRQGCEVDLVDPVQRHVDQAAERFKAEGLPGRAQLGDARELPFGDETRDAVLLLGPLYHLTERSDRIRTLEEARRVAKRGAPVFVGAISRFASLLDGFSRQLIRDPAFVRILVQDLETGQHRNPTANPDYFTTAFFHAPAELTAEIEEAGLELELFVGVEGPFWSMANFDELWRDPGSRALMLSMLRKVDSEPSLLGASAHWLVAARRPA